MNLINIKKKNTLFCHRFLYFEQHSKEELENIIVMTIGGTPNSFTCDQVSKLADLFHNHTARTVSITVSQAIKEGPYKRALHAAHFKRVSVNNKTFFIPCNCLDKSCGKEMPPDELIRVS